MFVSFTRRISTRRRQLQSVESGGHDVVKESTKLPRPPTVKFLGFTSTCPSAMFYIPSNSTWRVIGIPSVHLNTTLVYLLLLLRTTPNLMSLIPSESTNYFKHLISGMREITAKLIESVPCVPSIRISSFPFTSQSQIVGVFTPTMKLQTPLCEALNLYSSKYSQAFYFRTPKMYSGSSFNSSSSYKMLKEITLASSCFSLRVTPILRYETVPAIHSPK